MKTILQVSLSVVEFRADIYGRWFKKLMSCHQVWVWLAGTSRLKNIPSLWLVPVNHTHTWWHDMNQWIYLKDSFYRSHCVVFCWSLWVQPYTFFHFRPSTTPAYDRRPWISDAFVKVGGAQKTRGLRPHPHGADFLVKLHKSWTFGPTLQIRCPETHFSETRSQGRFR